MRATVALLLALVTAPLAADWRETGGTSLVWFSQRATADINEVRDALLWYYDRQETITGLVAQGARPHFTVTSVGGGNSELSITLPLTAGNNWVTAMAATPCPAANTTTLRRACVDTLIKADFKRLWRSYRAFLREQSTPVVEPPDL